MSGICIPNCNLYVRVTDPLDESYLGSYHRHTYKLRNTIQKSLNDIQNALSRSLFTKPKRRRRRLVHKGEWSPQSPLHSWPPSTDSTSDKVGMLCLSSGLAAQSKPPSHDIIIGTAPWQKCASHYLWAVNDMTSFSLFFWPRDSPVDSLA